MNISHIYLGRGNISYFEGLTAPGAQGELLARGVRAFRTNAYNVGRAGFDPEDTPDLRKAVFAVTSRINHSCAPNCAPLPWPVRGHTGNSFKSHPGLDASAAGGWGATLVVIALRRILPGEELVTNYFDEVWEPRELRRKVLTPSLSGETLEPFVAASPRSVHPDVALFGQLRLDSDSRHIHSDSRLSCRVGREQFNNFQDLYLTPGPESGPEFYSGE